jgi:hypothetical protein
MSFLYRLKVKMDTFFLEQFTYLYSSNELVAPGVERELYIS